MSFSRSVRLFVSNQLSPEARSQALASFARADVSRLQAERRAPLAYTVFVDGRENAAPETVKPEGRIVYLFNGLSEAVAFALGYCISRSPVLTGRYKRSWFVLVDGRAWNASFADIPAGSEVIVVNTQPYHRKLEMGSIGMGARGDSQGRRGNYVSVTRACRDELRRRFPGVYASHDFVELPAGPAPAPYVMKGGLVLKRTARKSKFSRVGEQMTYPCVVLKWGAGNG